MTVQLVEADWRGQSLLDCAVDEREMYGMGDVAAEFSLVQGQRRQSLEERIDVMVVILTESEAAETAEVN